jgi:hypothetical protein
VSDTSTHTGLAVKVMKRLEPLKILSKAKASCKFFCIKQGPDVKVDGKITLQPMKDKSRPSHKASMRP